MMRSQLISTLHPLAAPRLRSLVAKRPLSRIGASAVENSAKREIPAPVDVCYQLWLDRALIPAWMPWIHSVNVMQVLEEDQALSCWVLRTEQFGREWELMWVARSLEPIPLKKVHWKSEKPPPGFKMSGPAVELENTGSVRFFPVSAASCAVTLSIAYEVPSVLLPFANLLTPVVEAVLADNLQRFEKYATTAFRQQSRTAARSQD